MRLRFIVFLSYLLISQAIPFAQSPSTLGVPSGFPAWIVPPTFINGAGVPNGNILMPTGNCYAWNNPADLLLCRDAANTLAIRNGTNPQEIRSYNTFTDAANYERILLSWNDTSNQFNIRTQAAGTGAVRALGLGVGGLATATQWVINTSGNFVDQGTHTITAGSTISGTAYQISGLAFGTSTIGPSSVAGTTITANLVMAGLGGSFTTRTGRFEICMSGNMDNTNANDGTKAQISFGTTVPTPTLNAPLQGTQVGPIQQNSQVALPAATITPFGACWIVTGQTVNTAFWTDIAYGAVTGGTGVLSQASVVAHDIP